MNLSELNKLIATAEQENQDLDDHGDIPPDSYRIFNELIEGIKKYIQAQSS